MDGVAMPNHCGLERRHYFWRCVMGLLTKVRASASAAASSKKPSGTTWKLEPRHNDSVQLLVDLKSQIKALEAQVKPLAAELTNVASQLYCEHVMSSGMSPETPVKLSTSKNVLTFVQQRRSGKVTDADVDVMRDVVGDDVLDLVYEETSISFNPTILNKEGVFRIVEKHLDAAVRQMLKEGVATSEEVDELMHAETMRTWVPDVQNRGARLCDNADKLGEFYDALGSSCVRYVKT